MQEASYISLAVPFISVITDTLVKPKIKQLLDRREIDKNFFDLVDQKFKDYLIRAYKNNSIMNTIVFRNQQKLIEDLYIPLTLRKITNNQTNEEILIDSYKDELISKYKRILITDTAGMGKSTLMKWLFKGCIQQKAGIPIFIELRKLSEPNTIINEIKAQINPIEGEFNEDYILRLLARGDFIFFLDGYDEIPTDFKETVTSDLRSFVEKTGDNLFVMSSREESALMSFGDFQRFNIKQLTEDEAYNLIRKYDNNGKLSTELIEKIKADNNLHIIKEFLTNPLMTALLYNAYEYKKKIPYKKSIFYSQVYDALFESHDYTKTGGEIHVKKSKLDIDDFERILRMISYESFKKGIISYDRDQIINLLDYAKTKSANITFKSSDYLNDLILSVPLFIKEGNQYRWAHKSLQEYFAAKYICFDLKEKQSKVLLSMSKSKRNSEYFNVLDFCYDLDYPTFRKTVIYDLATSFIKYYLSSYSDKFISKFDNKIIDHRKKLTFGREYFFLNHSEFRKKETGLIEKILVMMNADGLRLEDVNTCKQFSVLIGSNSKGIIIKLLQNKQSNLIGMTSPSFCEDMSPNIKKGQIIRLDDSIDNFLNQESLFEPITLMLGAYVLDFEECKKLVNQIDRDNKNNNDDEDIF